MLLGAITAHYGVEGQTRYGFPLSEVVAVQRDPNLAHSACRCSGSPPPGLAAGLFIGPAGRASRSRRVQRLGVNVSWVCLLVVVVGSLTGEWLSIHNKMADTCRSTSVIRATSTSTWARAGRSCLFVGLLLWLLLDDSSAAARFAKPGETETARGLAVRLTGAIALFYGAGLTWGQHTHLSMVEYWRWWVVHLWVEGFFEVFATDGHRLHLHALESDSTRHRGRSGLLSATIFLSGGIIGTCHHLYFSGTPTVALAWGSVFSALEVVPLVLVGFDAIEDLRRSRTSPWVQRYKWPIYFFVAVAFWNMVGAGLFGFMINPPIALYYMQGLNTTPLHGHAALFGVYGMLGSA